MASRQLRVVRGGFRFRHRRDVRLGVELVQQTERDAGLLAEPDSEPLAAKEAPPNRPAAWIFLAAAWNRLRPEPEPEAFAAPGATAFFFEGDEYRPSMDFLRLP